MTRRALDLAAMGIGLVSPNPLVGCVIVSEKGIVVGEGTYRYDDVTHAEVIALSQAGADAHGGTAYVSLEPHSHHGKTSPCTEALITAGIRRVVSPIVDPNPLVAGRGFQKLKESGIEVLSGILAHDAERLNEKFTVWHRKGRPFVHLKMAMSIDGRISLQNSISTALSSPAAIQRVHELRHEHDAILVGGNTAFVDDPSLTDRSGLQRRRKLVRIVLDNRLRLATTSKLAVTANETPTFVFTNSRHEEKIADLRKLGVEVVQEDARDLSAVLAFLRSRDLQSVLVEGGSEVAGAFVDERLVDKLTFIVAPLVIGGREAPPAISGLGAESIEDALRIDGLQITRLGEDLELTGYPAPFTAA